MTTWGELLERTEQQLTELDVANARTEAQWIIEDASGAASSELRGMRAEIAPARAIEAVDRMLARRTAGEPLQYVLGHWAFRNLDLMVDTRVLIPRPETEWVVECALLALEARGVRRGARNAWSGTETSLRVADLGTGSGAIALALAHELGDAEVWATDASADALAVARANIAGAGSSAARIRVAHGSWFGALPAELAGTFALIVSNPPYIAEPELVTLDAEVRDFEPVSALVSGPTGLEAITELVTHAPSWLADTGVFVCEIAPSQAEQTYEIAIAAGFARASVANDLAGRPRALVAERNIP
jgi:release factor glutamine methyltransferase